MRERNKSCARKRKRKRAITIISNAGFKTLAIFFAVEEQIRPAGPAMTPARARAKYSKPAMRSCPRERQELSPKKKSDRTLLCNDCLASPSACDQLLNLHATMIKLM